MWRLLAWSGRLILLEAFDFSPYISLCMLSDVYILKYPGEKAYKWPSSSHTNFMFQGLFYLKLQGDF